MKRSGLQRRKPASDDDSERGQRRAAALSKANPPRPPANVPIPEPEEPEVPPPPPIRPSGRTRRTAQRRAKRVPFNAVRSGLPPARTLLCSRCEKRKASNWHHWLPQQHIRAYVRSRRLDEDEARALEYTLLHDRRNLSPLCGTCHDEEGGVLRPDDVPPSAVFFAVELGGEWIARLNHRYRVWPRP